jgi:hypothetical protein
MITELPYAEPIALKPDGHKAWMERNKQFTEAANTKRAHCS